MRNKTKKMTDVKDTIYNAGTIIREHGLYRQMAFLTLSPRASRLAHPVTSIVGSPSTTGSAPGLTEKTVYPQQSSYPSRGRGWGWVKCAWFLLNFQLSDKISSLFLPPLFPCWSKWRGREVRKTMLVGFLPQERTLESLEKPSLATPVLCWLGPVAFLSVLASSSPESFHSNLSELPSCLISLAHTFT